ncbi:MAG: hypothetical protein ACYDG6_06390 [Thermincolia bacterium]
MLFGEENWYGGIRVIGSFTVPRGSQGMVYVDGTAVEVARYFAPGGVQDVAYDGRLGLVV